MTRKAGVPVAVLIIVGVITGVILLLIGRLNPLMFILGLIPSLIVFGGAVLAYLWLNRWEPAPIQLLIFAFLWGGGVATGGALLVGELMDALGVDDQSFMVVVQAPIVEEALKACFLVIMMTGRRRARMNTMTDFLVYAGFVGLGFAFVEDLLYLSSMGSVSEMVVVAVFRLVFGIFAHPFFTSATALGLYAATRVNNVAAKIALSVLGFGVAIGLHMLWNGSITFFGFEGYLAAYALILLPLFIGLVVVAVLARNNEGKRVRAQLPGMVHEWLIAPQEAAWLTALSHRGARIREVRKVCGVAAARQVRHFADAVTELAFVRSRTLPGTPDQQSARHEELMSAVRMERELAVPFLQQTWRANPPSMVWLPQQVPTNPGLPPGQPNRQHTVAFSGVPGIPDAAPGWEHGAHSN